MGEGQGQTWPGGWTPPPSGTVPPGFSPVPGGDPDVPGTSFQNPATGGSIHWGGTMWVKDSGGPFTYSYDPETGQTAYQNPKTGGWDVHIPPKWFVVDDEVPPDQLGVHYVNLNGQRIYFSVVEDAWIDEATHRPLPPRTQEKPGTGDEAGKVDVPEPDPNAAPPEDSPQDAMAKDSIASSKLAALQKGDFSVPHGVSAPDYRKDLINLYDSLVLRQNMIAQGASASELAIVEGHIADIATYIGLWNTKHGAKAVNDKAQMDDLTAQVEHVKGILETGLNTAGGEAGGNLGKFIDSRGIGGGGSRTVVPKHKTAKSYLDAQKGTGTGGTPSGAKGGSTGTPPGKAVDPQAKTAPLPVVKPATSDTDTMSLPGSKTDAGRPARSHLDEMAASAKARQEAANKAAQKSGYKDYDEMQVALNEKKARERALKGQEDHTIFGQREGEAPKVSADRFAKENSLGGTKYDPSAAWINMKGARRDLEQMSTGTSKTVKSTQKNLEARFREYEAAQQSVKDGKAKFKDYDERMSPVDREMVREEMKAAEGKDLKYWQDRFNASGADGKGGRAPAPASAAPPDGGAPGYAPGASGGGSTMTLPQSTRGLSNVGRNAAFGVIAATLLVGVIFGMTALGGPGAAASATPGVAASAGPTAGPNVTTVPPTAGAGTPAALDLSKIQWKIYTEAQRNSDGSGACRYMVSARVDLLALGGSPEETQALLTHVIGKAAIVRMSGPGLPDQIEVPLTSQGGNTGEFGIVTKATAGAVYQTTLASAAGIPLGIVADTFANPCR